MGNFNKVTANIKLILQTLFLFIFLSGHFCFSKQDTSKTFEIPFNNSDLKRSQDIARSILQMYPSKKYYYIFIGRSLTMVRALFDVYGIQNTGLPLSGKEIDLSFSTPLGSSVKPLIRQHLDLYLPDEEAFLGKELVLLDFTVSGRGLIAARSLLDWYFKGGQQLNLLRVDTKSQLPTTTIQYLGHLLVGRHLEKTVVIQNGSIEHLYLLNSNYDSFAGYGGFDITTGMYFDRQADAKERYDALKNWIKSHLKSHQEETSRQNSIPVEAKLFPYCSGYL